MARDVAAAPTTSPSRVVMMSARSKPQPPPPAPAPSIYSYLHSQSGLNFAPVVQQQTSSSGEGSPPPAPPVRDASSLKSIKYGPGHEKFPSWPSDTPRPAASGGGSHRSKSWTDHTNYPKEKGITYTRPYMKRPNPAFTQQLKTVMEKCEKIPPETFESRPDGEQGSRMYLPRVDREGKALGDNDYMVPSPPERDVMSSKPQLTQADLEEYARSYQDPPQLTQVELEEYARSYQEPKPQSAHLTQADLEEYARTYEESLRPQHQQQQSYAQSEGYHSYVSSTDSITTTPFLDRLRRDSEATARPMTITQSSSWDESSATERPGRDSVVTTSSGSASSSETLKWHGSLSDVSVASSSCLAPASSRQLIAHSARVPTPQRHHSESVLYLGNSNWVQRNNHHNQLRLFPVNTYTVQPSEQPQPQSQQSSHRMTPLSPPPPTLSVAERISELERQQTRYTYLDPEKRHRVSDPTLKAIQKKALLSFYERHHSANNTRNQTWRSEPQLAQSTTVAPQSPPPQPPPRPRGNQSGRRASSASDYAGGNWREATANRENGNIEPGSIQDSPRHQHSSSCGSLSADLLGPLIIGPSISVDDWVPERPPKKPHLRAAFPPPVPDRLPSPDLPPPSPPPVLEDEVFISDEPLPPPPPELHSPDWNETEVSQKQHSPRSSSAHPQSPKQRERSPEESETQNDSSRPQRSFVGASLQEHCESSNSLQVPIALNATRHISNSNTNSSMSSNNNNNNNHSQRPHDANTQEKHNNVNQNGISSQRSMDRAFSLSRSIEDCSSQKSSQRQQNSVTQRYREGTPALKPISNGTSKAESSYQQYRSSTVRHFENGQKQTDCSSLPRSNGSSTSLLQKYQDSNNRISQLNYVPAYKNMNETFSRTSSIRQPDTSMTRLSGSRSSLRYPTTQKLMVNGKLFSEQSPHLERGTQRTSSILLPPKTHFQRFTEASTEDKSSSQQSLAQQDPPPTLPRLSIHNPQSTSKASYLHRDRGLPNFEGSYKRTMSPSGQEQEPPAAAAPTTVAAECDNRVPSATSQPNNEQQAVSSVVVLTSVMTTDNKENVRTSNSEENTKNESESGDTVIRCKTTWSSSPVSPPDTTKETETQTQCSRQSPPPPSPPARSPPASPSPPLVTESLQLVQRSEVVLRVNAATSDAASQTESERELEQEQQTPPSPTVPPPLPVRQKLQEEIDCERLSLDLASHLSPSDKLQGILVPAPEHKKLTDYVSGLFRLDTAPRPRTTSATALRTSSTITSTTATNQTTTTTLITTVNHVPASSTDSTSQVEEARESSDTAPLSANSAYFTTSESKAKFLTQYGRDMTQSEQLNGICDNKELQKKKEELMARLTRKLQVLRGEHLVVTEESRVNDELGENVAAQVNRLARPHEASKYRLHVEEVGKITSLLLGLSGRLARAENALMGLPNHHAERKILESKRDKLREQLEEAKKLKENIDRRSVCVSNILYKYFNAEEYADYDHFINMKAKLIMDSREIADKIKLGEEQLAALKETLTAPD